MEFDRNTLFCRMIGILDQQELDALAEKTVAVPGCGGGGYTHAESLVRMGVGRIKIADFDTFGAENIGRQFGATIHTVGRSKTAVLEERLRSINPAIVVEVFKGVSDATVAPFLADVDFVCDAIDYFSISARRLICRGLSPNGMKALVASRSNSAVSRASSKRSPPPWGTCSAGLASIRLRPGSARLKRRPERS